MRKQKKRKKQQRVLFELTIPIQLVKTNVRMICSIRAGIFFHVMHKE